MFKLRLKVSDDGSIYIKGLPLKPGKYVEVMVTVLPDDQKADAERYPLRGLANDDNFQYFLPFEPADQEKWEKVLENVTPYEREGRPETPDAEEPEDPADNRL